VDLVSLSDGVESRTHVGRILVTTFGNQWFPLVRFDIGDIARIAPGPCPCGRDFGVTLSAIEGRLKSLCVAEDGRLVTHRELDEALACVDGLEQYRLVQEDLKHVRLDLIHEDGQWNRVARDATDILHDLFGPGVHIALSKVDELLPERSGKFLLAKRNFSFGPGFAPESTEAHHG
jgi:phenylacetate-CoA ligase